MIIDLPDNVAEKYRYRFDDGDPYLGNFCVPFEGVNAAEPFQLHRLRQTTAAVAHHGQLSVTAEY